MRVRRRQPGDANPASDPRTDAARPESPGASTARTGIVARLERTRQAVTAPFGRMRAGRIDETTFDELEETLVLADVGLKSTARILDALRDKVRAGTVDAPGALAEALRTEIAAGFAGEDRALRLVEEPPSVWLFVGVNGAGKTTSIGKLAAQQVAQGRRVVVAAGDTFRAAAGDQLAGWAARCGATLVRGADGADPSSVIFDAIEHAVARHCDLVLADSAGRLHTKTNLMDELRKVKRVADRPPGRVSEVLLVIDATTGQNGLVQAREFTRAVGVTGIVLTKLDGTAKGGIVLAIREELGLPIKLVGIGEGADDLVTFDPDEFATALAGA
ncbi:MAG: signal recognition particle-docking protein FtsY [Acidimicrobiales bacterium]